MGIAGSLCNKFDFEQTALSPDKQEETENGKEWSNTRNTKQRRMEQEGGKKLREYTPLINCIATTIFGSGGACLTKTTRHERRLTYKQNGSETPKRFNDKGAVGRTCD